MFFKNIELHEKYKKHCALRKKEATEFITFGYSKSEKEKFISSKKLLFLHMQRRYWEIPIEKDRVDVL